MFRTLGHRSNLRRLTVAVWYAMEERHLGLIAAGVAFYAMLAVFPGLAALIALWGFFSDPSVIDDYMVLLKEFIPADALHLIEDEVARLLSANAGGLRWTTFLSLGIGLYSAWSAVNALIDAMNAVHARRYRPGLKRYTFALILTFGFTGLLLSALLLMVLVPTALAFIPAAADYPWLVKAIPTTVMVVAVIVFLGMLYRWGPNQTDKPAWITPGAILAAVLWAIASIAFSYYLANFASYNRIYGSIGAVVALIMWFYISAYIILLGGTVNAEISHIKMH